MHKTKKRLKDMLNLDTGVILFNETNVDWKNTTFKKNITIESRNTGQPIGHNFQPAE